MFWEERQVQLALEGGGGEEGAGQAAVAAQEVHMPLIEHLKVCAAFTSLSVLLARQAAKARFQRNPAAAGRWHAVH